MGRELQKYTDEGMLFSCEEIFEKYESEQAWNEFGKKLMEHHASQTIKEIIKMVDISNGK